MKANDEIRDPHCKKAYYLKRSQSVPGVTKENESIILQYLQDMELGRNVSTVKGERSYGRLNALYTRMRRLAMLFEEHFSKNLIELTDLELAKLFKMLRDGVILSNKGKAYRSVRDFAKTFKAFWHWYQKVMRKDNQEDIPDITVDLDTSSEKPEFVYFTFEQMKEMADNALFKYKVLMWFLFDSGIRAPKECFNVRVSDLQELKDNSGLQLTIREPTSKTFGRKIKLLLCANYLKKYIKEENLSENDFIFNFSPTIVNRYLKRRGKKYLNNENLTMYDFRHASACHWLPIYKHEPAMKYRFGWKKSEMILYYTEHLGMRDTLQEEDLYDDDQKTQLEMENESYKKQIQILNDQIASLKEQQEKDVQMLIKMIESRSFTEAEIPEIRGIVERVHDVIKVI